MWCQTCEFSHYLKSYFDEDEQKNNIIKNNIYKERYNTNNDVFVHIRLGDIIEHIDLTTKSLELNTMFYKINRISNTSKNRILVNPIMH
jgi:hypothetical protein